MDPAAVTAVQLFCDGSLTALLPVHSRRGVEVDRQLAPSGLSWRRGNRLRSEGRETQKPLSEIVRSQVTELVDSQEEGLLAIHEPLIVFLNSLVSWKVRSRISNSLQLLEGFQ